MRTLILFFLLPLAASGQRFDISVQSGYSITDDLPEDHNRKQLHGLSNQVSVGYHFSQHFLLNVFYEWNIWGSNAINYLYSPDLGAAISNNHSFGISPNYTSKHFFAGINLQLAKVDNIDNKDAMYSFRYKNTICGGVHAGAQQKIYKHLYITEYLGCNVLIAKGTVEFYSINHGTTTTYPGYTDVSEKFLVYYFHAGLSYELAFNKKAKPKKPE